MLIFLYGQDTYRLKKKVNEIIAEYRKKYSSGLNLAEIDMSEVDISVLREKINVVSMFSEKKMIILVNAFGDALRERNLLNYLIKNELVQDESIILIVKKYVDADTIRFKRGTARKNNNEKQNELLDFLFKNSRCQEFKLLGLVQLKKWVSCYFQKEGVNISEGALVKLLDFVGDDLWQMDQEMMKLLSYKSYKSDEAGKFIITEEDVERLVEPKINPDIFRTIDGFAQKDRKSVLSLLKKHFQDGEDALYLLSMLVYQFRNIIKVKDFMEKGFADKNIAEQMKAHPYVLQKSIAQAKLFRLPELKKIYQMFFRVDLAIKTGRVKPETALDLLAMEITK